MIHEASAEVADFLLVVSSFLRVQLLETESVPEGLHIQITAKTFVFLKRHELAVMRPLRLVVFNFHRCVATPGAVCFAALCEHRDKASEMYGILGTTARMKHDSKCTLSRNNTVWVVLGPSITVCMQGAQQVASDAFIVTLWCGGVAVDLHGGPCGRSVEPRPRLHTPCGGTSPHGASRTLSYWLCFSSKLARNFYNTLSRTLSYSRTCNRTRPHRL